MAFGFPFLYQGQELGMENMAFKSIDEVDDISTHDQYKLALEHGLSEEEALKAVARRSRDNARVPMQWNDSKHAGFTAGIPWLRVNPNYVDINAKDQMNRKDSVYAFYKELIALRKTEEYKECIVYGQQIPVFEEVENLMAFYRKGEDKTLLVIANFQKEAREIELPEEVKKIVVNNYENVVVVDKKIVLNGYHFLVVEV